MKQEKDTFKAIIENKQHGAHSPKQEKLAKNKVSKPSPHKQEHYHNRGNR